MFIDLGEFNCAPPLEIEKIMNLISNFGAMAMSAALPVVI